jgi:hypothetical protein
VRVFASTRSQSPVEPRVSLPKVMKMDEAVKSGLAEITRLRVKFRNSKSSTRSISPVGDDDDFNK